MMKDIVKEMRELGVKSVTFGPPMMGGVRPVVSIELFQEEPLPPLEDIMNDNTPTDRPPRHDVPRDTLRAINILRGGRVSDGTEES